MRIMSYPSCTAKEYADSPKEKAYSHYDKVIEELMEQVRKNLRNSVAEIFDNHNNYGQTVTIQLQSSVKMTDLFHNIVSN